MASPAHAGRPDKMRLASVGSTPQKGMPHPSKAPNPELAAAHMANATRSCMAWTATNKEGLRVLTSLVNAILRRSKIIELERPDSCADDLIAARSLVAQEIIGAVLAALLIVHRLEEAYVSIDSCLRSLQSQWEHAALHSHRSPRAGSNRCIIAMTERIAKLCTELRDVYASELCVKQATVNALIPADCVPGALRALRLTSSGGAADTSDARKAPTGSGNMDASTTTGGIVGTDDASDEITEALLMDELAAAHASGNELSSPYLPPSREGDSEYMMSLLSAWSAQMFVSSDTTDSLLYALSTLVE